MTAKNIYIPIITGILGITFGIVLHRNYESSKSPHTIYERKLEGDKREFLVTESINGYVSFVRTNSDRPYKLFTDFQEVENKTRKKEFDGLQKKLVSEIESSDKRDK